MLDELPKGATTFGTISLSLNTYANSRLQWDGSYLTVQNDQKLATVYRIAITGSTGRVVGIVKLAKDFRAYTWIEGDTILAGHWVSGQKKFKNYAVGFWHYPRGGNPYKLVKILPTKRKPGVTFLAVSVAPSP
jgi:hypothetical protein